MTRVSLKQSGFQSVLVSVLATVVVLSAATAPARADCSPQWLSGPQQQVPGHDRYLYAATMWDADGPGPEPERLVIGGYFSVAGGTPAMHIARWDGTS